MRYYCLFRLHYFITTNNLTYLIRRYLTACKIKKTSWKIPGDRSRSKRYPSHAPYLFTVGQKFCRFCMFLIVSWTPSTFTISHTSVAYGIGRYSMVKLDIAVHLTVVLIESSSWLTSSLRMGNWQSVNYRRASWRCIWRQSEIIGHHYYQHCF